MNLGEYAEEATIIQDEAKSGVGFATIQTLISIAHPRDWRSFLFSWGGELEFVAIKS